MKRAADNLGLSVDTQKSKVMICRIGGRIAAHDKWFIGGERLEVVKEYNYLGKIFSSKLSSSTAVIKQREKEPMWFRLVNLRRMGNQGTTK